MNDDDWCMMLHSMVMMMSYDGVRMISASNSNFLHLAIVVSVDKIKTFGGDMISAKHIMSHMRLLFSSPACHLGLAAIKMF